LERNARYIPADVYRGGSGSTRTLDGVVEEGGDLLRVRRLGGGGEGEAARHLRHGGGGEDAGGGARDITRVIART
jgi:hypothetical protein